MSIESVPGVRIFSAVRPYHQDYSHLRIAREGRSVPPPGSALACQYLREAQYEHRLTDEETGVLLQRRGVATYVGNLTARLYDRRQEIIGKSNLENTAVTDLLSREYGMPVCGDKGVDSVRWWLSGALPGDVLDHQSALLLYNYVDPNRPLINNGFFLELDSRGYVNMLPGTIYLHGCGDITQIGGLAEALQIDVAMLTHD